MISSQLRAAGKALLILSSLAWTAACSGGGSAIIAGGGTGGGGGGGSGAKFVWEDLNGDWIGQLKPAPAASTQAHNAYLRWANLRLTEAAESGGTEFLEGNSVRTFKFTGKGALSVDLQASAGVARLLLSGQMDETSSVLQGTFKLTEADGSEIVGDFHFTRSAGAGQFTQDMLGKPWDGLGRNGVGKFRFLKFELDADGVVVTGIMKHPETEVKIRDYSPGSGTFTFADTSIGRINNVVMVSDQGQTLSFPFMLLDVDATLLSGSGVESELGSGIGELVPGL